MENKMAVCDDPNIDFYPVEGAYPKDKYLMEPQVERLVQLASSSARSDAEAARLHRENRDLKCKLDEVKNKLGNTEYWRDNYKDTIRNLREENAKLLKKIPKKPVKKTLKTAKKGKKQ